MSSIAPKTQDPTSSALDERHIAAIVAETVRKLQGAAALSEAPAPITLADFFHHYKMNYATIHFTARSIEHFDQCFRLYLSPWGNRLLTEISRSDVIELQSSLMRNHGKVSSNHTIELLCMMFYKAINWNMFDGNNPAARLRKFKVEQRERFLLPEELPKFIEAVKSLRGQTSTDFFLMLLYTAQRRRNVCEMQWADIDLDRAVWRIPMTKNRTSHNVPLVAEAVEIIKRRRLSKDVHSTWVFAKQDGSGPVWNLNTAWNSVLKRAGLKDLRIHDLRRSHASWQAISGVNTAIIGATLNHKDPRSTMIYARLYLEPIRTAMQQAVNSMCEAAAGSVSAPTPN